MDASRFSDERLLNTIRQAYHFHPDMVKAVISEALSRELVDDAKLQQMAIESKEMARRNAESDQKENEKLRRLSERARREKKLVMAIPILNPRNPVS